MGPFLQLLTCCYRSSAAPGCISSSNMGCIAYVSTTSFDTACVPCATEPSAAPAPLRPEGNMCTTCRAAAISQCDPDCLLQSCYRKACQTANRPAVEFGGQNWSAERVFKAYTETRDAVSRLTCGCTVMATWSTADIMPRQCPLAL